MKKEKKPRAVSLYDNRRSQKKKRFFERLDAILPLLPLSTATIICDIHEKTEKEKQLIHNVISGRTQNEKVLSELETFAKDYNTFLGELRVKAQETKTSAICINIVN